MPLACTTYGLAHNNCCQSVLNAVKIIHLKSTSNIVVSRLNSHKTKTNTSVLISRNLNEFKTLLNTLIFILANSPLNELTANFPKESWISNTNVIFYLWANENYHYQLTIFNYSSTLDSECILSNDWNLL